MFIYVRINAINIITDAGVRIIVLIIMFIIVMLAMIATMLAIVLV